MKAYFEGYLYQVTEALKNIQVTNQNGKAIATDYALEQLANRVKEIQTNQQGLIFFCGNGASATMAEHFSHDWFQNARVNTYTCSETAHITAIANDISFENIFSYRIERIFSSKDILVTISSSGNSPNIINAIHEARKKKGFIITISGKKEDNESRGLGDLNFYVPLQTYGMVESAHAILLHAALDYFLDKYMDGKH